MKWVSAWSAMSNVVKHHVAETLAAEHPEVDRYTINKCVAQQRHDMLHLLSVEAGGVVSQREETP